MNDFPVDKSHFLGLVIGLILYGVYTCLFVLFLWWANQEKSRPHPKVMWTLVLLYAISTAVVVCWVINNSFAFLRYRDTIGPVKYFLSPRAFYGIRILFSVLGTAIADSLFAWRLYIVYNRQRSLLFFFAPLTVVGGATGLVLVVYGFKTAQVGDYRYQPMQNVVGLTGVGVTVLFNVLATSFIAGRLWSLGREVAHANVTSNKLYKRVAAVIIDSGVIYTVTMITFIIVGGLGLSGAQNFVFYLVPMVVGIVPTLMVIRLNFAQISGPFSYPPSSDRTAFSTLRFLPNPNLVSQTETIDVLGSSASGIVPDEPPKLGLRQLADTSVEKFADEIALEDLTQKRRSRGTEGSP